MGKILGVLSGPFGMYVLIAVAIAFVGMAVTIYVQGVRLDAVKAEASKWEHSSKTLQADGAAKDVAIDQLAKSARELADAADRRALEVRAAGQHLATLTSELQESILRIQTLEESDRALPHCEALMRVDLARVCPATAAGMRERAARPVAAANSR